MAIKLSDSLEGMARQVSERMDRRAGDVEVAIRDAVTVLQLIWVQVVQDSVASPTSAQWWVSDKGETEETQKRKRRAVHPPARRSSIIAQGGEIGWRAWGNMSRSLARYRIRRDAFELRIKEVVSEAFRGAVE